MSSQLELWSDGWAVEPCDTGPPDWTDDDLAAWLHTRPRPIPGDHGRPAGRATYWRTRRITTIEPTEEYL